MRRNLWSPIEKRHNQNAQRQNRSIISFSSRTGKKDSSGLKMKSLFTSQQEAYLGAVLGRRQSILNGKHVQQKHTSSQFTLMSGHFHFTTKSAECWPIHFAQNWPTWQEDIQQQYWAQAGTKTNKKNNNSLDQWSEHFHQATEVVCDSSQKDCILSKQHVKRASLLLLPHHSLFHDWRLRCTHLRAKRKLPLSEDKTNNYSDTRERTHCWPRA